MRPPGALGAATSKRARERQLELMQEMGSNAIRTAHNPFEPEFYELADRMGFLVMDEVAIVLPARPGPATRTAGCRRAQVNPD